MQVDRNPPELQQRSREVPGNKSVGGSERENTRARVKVEVELIQDRGWMWRKRIKRGKNEPRNKMGSTMYFEMKPERGTLVVTAWKSLRN